MGIGSRKFVGNEDHEERLRTGTVENFVIEFSQVLVLLHDVLKLESEAKILSQLLFKN